MLKKVIFVSAVFLVLVFSRMTGQCFAGASDQLEQAGIYREAKDYRKTEQVYLSILKQFADIDYAFQAQKELATLYVAWNKRRPAEAAFEELIADFYEHEQMAKAVYDIAASCQSFRKYKSAVELHQYLLDNWPQDEYAILSQAGMAISYISLGLYEAADATIEDLLTEFSEHEDIAKAVHDIAAYCHDLEEYEKARKLYQHVLDNWPQDGYAIWSQAGLAISNIGLGEDKAADAVINMLVADFNDSPDLPQALFLVGKQYYVTAFRDENRGRGIEAEDHFTKAIAVWEIIINGFPESNDTAEVYNHAADCYRRLGRYETAIAYYQMVVDNWPGCEYAWSALFRVGRIYENLKKSDLISKSGADVEIKAAYKQLIEMYPKCKAARYARRWLGRHNSK